jgi:hypothetical protein
LTEATFLAEAAFSWRSIALRPISSFPFLPWGAIPWWSVYTFTFIGVLVGSFGLGVNYGRCRFLVLLAFRLFDSLFIFDILLRLFIFLFQIGFLS